jgi:hypothetical protein
MAVIWCDDATNDAIETMDLFLKLSDALMSEFKMDVARHLAGIRGTEHLHLECSQAQLVAELISELSVSNARSMLASYGIETR